MLQHLFFAFTFWHCIINFSFLLSDLLILNLSTFSIKFKFFYAIKLSFDLTLSILIIKQTKLFHTLTIHNYKACQIHVLHF